MSFEAIAL
ncbi:hypothetical protein CGLO_02572 [Colletotrichum gloeosporioides Cg-14]|uniref:Uncharacterized protein n=1 Tax=Colletotrichum gloeosporioides (strain Cg-14) TaxID=1237896 RepID=T0KNJ7_COLGC|nr:hypothetical protein CGLO_02572 [Colletotrichum gloeosporioides Cg-14]